MKAVQSASKVRAVVTAALLALLCQTVGWSQESAQQFNNEFVPSQAVYSPVSAESRLDNDLDEGVFGADFIGSQTTDSVDAVIALNSWNQDAFPAPGSALSRTEQSAPPAPARNTGSKNMHQVSSRGFRGSPVEAMPIRPLPRPEVPEPRPSKNGPSPSSQSPDPVVDNDQWTAPQHEPVPQPVEAPSAEPLAGNQQPDWTTFVEVTDTGCNSCSGGGCQQCLVRGRTRIGRFLNGVYRGICCPDPCYQPKWLMLANASLFTDPLRPQSRQTFRWDCANNYPFPDRAEYLWGRSGVKGPSAERSIDVHDLTMLIETGGDKFSFFVKTPYRSTYLESGGHFGGIADITTGTKTLLHDTDLLQVALQFETHIPTSSPFKGLSNGHVSLEPALLMGIRLSGRSYLQTQIAEWIPLGGDPEYAGASLKYSASYNRTLFGCVSDTSLIGTIEYTGISYQDGAYTDPATPAVPIPASNLNLGLLGGGLRLNICNKVNFGIGGLFGITDHSPEATLRTEIQFRH